MTEPFDTDDIAVGLHHFAAAAAQHAQPPPVADIRRRAQRRRRAQIAGIAAGVALVALGGGVAVANSTLMANRNSGPAGPAASTDATSEPAPTSTPTTPTFGSKRYDVIPADYPMLSFVDDPGGDGSIDGPAETVPEVPIDPCGRRVWNPQGLIDSLAVRSNIPESPQLRQIVLFDDQAGAQDAMEEASDAFGACPVEQFGDGFSVNHYMRYQVDSQSGGSASSADLGDSSLTVSSRSTYDQAPAIGLTEMRWVRLDNAVIFTFDSSEAMGDGPGPGREANQRVGAMVQAWCDAAGC
ncbi:MAG: hypothetical protein M3499_06775 [Actinomycetota bacterium]|nr:hypothetical protein [Actinomycetota bacterium]